jgi:16S rRNA (guanine(966)-N(2))-methyltransferase RsmD
VVSKGFRMRVIAGKYRSRTLRSLKGQALRPTSDRLRETLFNILGPAMEGATLVDLYAGTGAVGIEALSRGARLAIFAEQHAPAVALIRRNLESLEIAAQAEVLGMNVLRAIQRMEAGHASAQYIFLDPPYAADVEYQSALEALGNSSVVAADGLVIVEHLKKRRLPQRVGNLQMGRVVQQGDAALSFYKVALASACGGRSLQGLNPAD